jgi:ribosome biogenesis SPOUT family RNA methylase Rps3
LVCRIEYSRGALIVGDDPPRDRTGELRKLGFEGRHLKEVQMTTDTAVGVSKRVVEDKGTSLVYL